MNETLQEFAELVGRCLAKRWLRERDLFNKTTAPRDAAAQRSAADDEKRVGRPCCSGPSASGRSGED